jgi:thiamine-monophosphate kinase
VSPESGPTVAEIGEFGLIDRLKRRFGSGGSGVVLGIGDDTAVLQVTPGRVLLATTDAAVEGVHFRRDRTSPEALGRRALAVNLSDVASMGGIPRWALVSLGMPAETPLAFVDGLAEGFAREAGCYGVAIVGGNLARSPERVVVDVTLLGEVEPGRALYRRGARPGDRILATGTLGDSAAGLAILEGVAPAGTAGDAWLAERHRLPTARIEAGRAIALSGLATAMLDLSDGLAGDLGHLAKESGVGAVVDAGRIPFSPALGELARAAGRDPLGWAIRGGEDYELLLTAPPENVTSLVAAVRATGVALTEIGTTTAEPGLWLRHPGGRREPLGEVDWQHFAR